MWQRSGFYNREIDVLASVELLERYIRLVQSNYPTFSKEELELKPAPNKWSRKEVLGHLIDSAINNLKRFTEIQFHAGAYSSQAYNQNELVVVNHYQELPLQHLIDLWSSLNRQIIYVITHVGAEKLELKVNPQYEDQQVRTFGWLFCDYVAHMEHHLKLILPLD